MNVILSIQFFVILTKANLERIKSYIKKLVKDIVRGLNGQQIITIVIFSGGK